MVVRKWRCLGVVHHTFFLLKKGVYSEETQNLVCIFVEANVSYVHIMGVIEAVLAAAGIKAVGSLSARTITQIVKEDYIAACIQLGYEMQAAEAVTLSADGIGHKNINYNSCHANYKIIDSHGKKTQVTHFLGIERSLDGSSEQAMIISYKEFMISPIKDHLPKRMIFLPG